MLLVQGFSAVDFPVMAPSCTLQKAGSPSHPERVRPSNRATGSARTKGRSSEKTRAEVVDRNFIAISRCRFEKFPCANDQALNVKKTQVNFGLFFLLYLDKLSSTASTRMPNIRAENVDTSTMTHLMG